jgi:hypothetical protein
MSRPTYEQAIAKAGAILATGRRTAEQMNPRELAEAAWHAGCSKSVDQLEDEIRQRRGLPLAHAS